MFGLISVYAFVPINSDGECIIPTDRLLYRESLPAYMSETVTCNTFDFALMFTKL